MRKSVRVRSSASLTNRLHTVGKLAIMAIVSAALAIGALGCGSSSSSVIPDDTASDATASTDSGFHNSDLGNGWQPIDSLDLEYATQFTIDYYDGGYKLACLGDGARYLIVPEGAEAP